MPEEEKPLNDNLKDYYDAISSEFSISSENDVVTKARNEITDLLPQAVIALRSLLIAGETESIRFNAIKLVFEHTMGKPGSGAAEDELTKIIAGLKTPKESKAPKADKTK